MNTERMRDPMHPAAVAAQRAPLGPELLTARCCELVYGTSVSSIAATLFAALLLSALMFPFADHRQILIWLALMLANLVGRTLLTCAWRQRSASGITTLARYQTRYRISISLAGLLWGATPSFLFLPGDPVHQQVLTVTLTGVVAVAVTTLAIDRRCVHSFTLLVMLPLILRYVLADERLSYVLACMSLFYLIFSMSNAERVHSGLRANLWLEAEAAEREQRLQQAQRLAHLGSFDFDVASGVMRWSDEHFRLWGLEPGSCAPDRALLLSRIHPDDVDFVTAALNNAIRTHEPYDCVHRLRWPDQTEHYIQARAEPVLDSRGRLVRMIGTVQNITRQRQAEERIRHLAFFDPLTELPNRHLLLDRLQHCLQRQQSEGGRGALIFIDLDNFKYLNDTHGHDRGDELLRLVGRRILATVRRSDTVARLGGDEFVVMLEGLGDAPASAERQAAQVGEEIRSALQTPYMLAGREFHSSCSVGVAHFGGSETSVDEVMKRADLAMYQAKGSGRNAVCIFTPSLEETATARSEIEADLRIALQRSEFTLHLQGQVDGAGHWIGAEALLRWQHPQRGAVSPAEMIPVAEESGLILPIGRWVLQNACHHLVRWAGIPELASFTIAVNVSARQFRQPSFVGEVLDALFSAGANPARLKIELTESLLLHDMEESIRKMEELRVHGVGFALDDFGTGYSSLSYLQRLPLEQLKIDQIFVRDVLTDPKHAAIASMILSLGQKFGLRVIAEGVESTGQRDFLAAAGCHGYQGYLFGRPLPVPEFEARMRAAPGGWAADPDQSALPGGPASRRIVSATLSTGVAAPYR